MSDKATVVAQPAPYESKLNSDDFDRKLAVETAIDLIHARCLGGGSLNLEMNLLPQYADHIQNA